MLSAMQSLNQDSLDKGISAVKAFTELTGVRQDSNWEQVQQI